MLLDHGAQIEVKDDQGETTLFRAVEPEMTGIWEFLVARGADPKARNCEGRTALEVMEERKAEVERKDLEYKEMEKESNRGRGEANSVYSEHASGTTSRSSSAHSRAGPLV